MDTKVIPLKSLRDSSVPPAADVAEYAQPDHEARRQDSRDCGWNNRSGRSPLEDGGERLKRAFIV